MTNKEKYRAYCRSESSIPIFSKDWWLDAVCTEGDWEVALIEDNGEIIASFPYYIKSKFGIKAITMPKLTQTAGIQIKYPKEQKTESRLSYEKKIINKLVDKLPQSHIFRQNFRYSFTNWQPLCWRGYNQTTYYTYVIENLSDPEIVFQNFSSSAKRNIRKAEKIVKVSSDGRIEDFYKINKKVFERQGIRYPYSLNLLKRIDDACSQNNSRKIFFAKDKYGKIYSAIYIIWDAECVYQLMSGSETELRNYNCKTLLVWEAIKFASSVTKKFDFDGSMVERIAEYNRRFGAEPKPYHYIFREDTVITKISHIFNLVTGKH